MVLYHINDLENLGHLDNQPRHFCWSQGVHKVSKVFHCRAYETCHLLEIQGEVSGFGHDCTQSVTKEQTYCYNKKLTICQMDTL